MADPDKTYKYKSQSSYIIPVNYFNVAIKAKNGKDPPVLALPKDGYLEYKAVPASGGGTFKWTATGNIVIEGGDTSEIVKIKGKAVSTGKDDSELKVVYTLHEQTTSDSKKLTVIKIEIKAMDGSAAPLFIGAAIEKKYKAVVTPSVALEEFKWSSKSKIPIIGDINRSTVIIKGNGYSGSIGDNTLGVEGKIGSNIIKTEIKLTVVKVEIKAGTGADAPLPYIVKGGEVQKYKCVVTPVIDPSVYTVAYKWETSSAKITINGSTAQISEIKGSSTSAALDDVTLKVKYTVNGAEIPAEHKMTVIEIKITPSTMHITESLDSNDFECIVQPAAVVVTDYEWLRSSADGSWPAAAGNNPALNYSYTLVAGKKKKAKVSHTRWFAKTNNRRYKVDGPLCIYKIYCKATVAGQKYKSPAPADLEVEVINLEGKCSFPSFQGSVVIAHSGGTWKVTGQGTFARSAPIVTIYTLNTSQFYAKVAGHENKHVHQWTAENPWKNLFNANALYTNTLRHLTSNVSQLDLQIKIQNAIMAKYNADAATGQSTMCTAEKGAFDEEKTIAPFFLEFDDADWKPIYGCP